MASIANAHAAARSSAMPERIQRKRLKGWRMPPGAIYVGRPGRWGNPYCAGHRCCFGGAFLPSPDTGDWQRELALPRFHETCWDVETSVRWFAELLDRCQPDVGTRLVALRGHDLACWCPHDQPCHADVLLELANA